MEIVPYLPGEHREGVERLNARFAKAGHVYQLPTMELATTEHRSAVWAEDFVAVDGNDVFGGYHLKHQDFFNDGQKTQLGYLQLPLSLGLLDRKYANVSAGLIFDAMRRSELLYCLGMGSQESNLVRILEAAGWQHLVVPFFFRVVAPNRFARNINLPSSQRSLQKVIRVAGACRLAGLALALRGIRKRTGRTGPRATDESCDVVQEFAGSASQLFERHAGEYSLVGDRSAEALACLYSPDNSKYIRLVIRRAGEVVGWAVVLDTQMRGHKYFGDMRVGSLADCFSAPREAGVVVSAADALLRRRGVDLIVSNQMHADWVRALEQAGYEQGPSNFFFYFSPALATQLSSRPDWNRRVHINRGDGDGPIHL